LKNTTSITRQNQNPKIWGERAEMNIGNQEQIENEKKKNQEKTMENEF